MKLLLVFVFSFSMPVFPGDYKGLNQLFSECLEIFLRMYIHLKVEDGISQMAGGRAASATPMWHLNLEKLCSHRKGQILLLWLEFCQGVFTPKPKNTLCCGISPLPASFSVHHCSELSVLTSIVSAFYLIITLYFTFISQLGTSCVST